MYCQSCSTKITVVEVPDSEAELHKEWHHLRSDHHLAAERIDAAETVTDAMADDEQEAWDALVDWVEANDLNYTQYDPRGTEDPTDEELRAADKLR